MPIVTKAAPCGHGCRIGVDTTCDFAPEVAAKLDVDIISFPYIVDGVPHDDDLWQSITPRGFYNQMRNGAKTSTSATSLGRYLEYFESCAEEGTPTVFLAFTAALSSACNNACTAADEVRAKHPGFELYVVDMCLPSAAGELMAIEAVRQRDAGLSAQELVAWAEGAKSRVHGYFTLDTLHFLAAGGRIPPAAAQLSTKLDIKAMLTFDLTGALSLTGVARGRKKALKNLVKSFRENYDPAAGLPISVISADAEGDADWLEDALRKEPGCAEATIIRGPVGPTIGAHVGPGMVAVLFWGKDRAEKVSVSDRIARRMRGDA